MAKKHLYVTIVGQAMTGKTSIMKLFIKTLQENKIEVTPVWGVDGEPRVPEDPDFDQKRLNAVANKTKVILAEHQAGRRGSGADIEHANDLGIQVVFDEDEDHGYGTRLIVMGQKLDKWFGTFTVSKDRARAVAARLSAELDIDVQDLVPTKHEWVQPR